MDKKSLIGLVLIGSILFFFSWYSARNQGEKQREQARVDSIARTERAVEQPVASSDTVAQFATDGDSLSAAQQTETYQQQLASSLGEQMYAATTGEEKFFNVENDRMILTFSNKGARVASVLLKDYKTYKGDSIRLFDVSSSAFDLSFYTNQQINTGNFYFQTELPQEIVIGENQANQTVSFRLYADSLAYIEYLYTIYKDNYMIDFQINFVGMKGILAQNQPDMLLQWGTVAPQNEKGFENENNYTTISYKYPGENSIEELGMSKETKQETIDSKLKWVAFKQQFFSSILIATNDFQNGEISYETFTPTSDSIKRFQARLSIPYSSNTTNYDFKFYFGPNKYNILNDYDLGLEKLIPLGGWIIGWINRLVVIPVFDFLGKSIFNYGIIILILTLILKIVIFPLTYKSYLSMAKMRLLKPEIDKLGEKFQKKEDALKKQQATMELYRSAGVSPMGGCLPMLIQFPILIAMFRFFPASIELRQKSFLWADDLSSYDSILNLPFDIPFYGSHVSLFTLLMAVSIFISSRISYSQNAGSAPQMAGMKFMMLYMMPLMMVLWFNNYSSGLSYYYLLSNIITIGQMYAFRHFIDDNKLHAKMNNNAKKPKKKSKWQQRYEDMLKQQQQQQNRLQKKK